jgi:hypothetical protein
MQNDADSDEGAPLGSWRNIHALVIGVLAAIVAFGTLISWMYR